MKSVQKYRQKHLQGLVEKIEQSVTLTGLWSWNCVFRLWLWCSEFSVRFRSRLRLHERRRLIGSAPGRTASISCSNRVPHQARWPTLSVPGGGGVSPGMAHNRDLASEGGGASYNFRCELTCLTWKSPEPKFYDGSAQAQAKSFGFFSLRLQLHNTGCTPISAAFENTQTNLRNIWEKTTALYVKQLRVFVQGRAGRNRGSLFPGWHKKPVPWFLQRPYSSYLQSHLEMPR